MNVKGVCRIVGTYLYLYTAIVVIAAFVSLYFHYSENELWETTRAFFQTALFCFVSAYALRKIAKKGEQKVFWKEGIFSVVLIWVITSLFAAMPLFFSGTVTNFVDCWFEGASMTTTTGATILYPKAYSEDGKEISITKKAASALDIGYTFYGTVTPVRDPETGLVIKEGIEAVPKGLLFWRSFMQLFGGLGMVMLFVAILPAIGKQRKVLFRYESLGPTFRQLFPTVRQTALALFSIYLLLIIGCFFSLRFTNANLSYFDAITITFSCVSTGGMAIKNASIAGFQSAQTEIVVMIFMLLGSINFALYYDLFRKRLYRLFDKTFLLYIALLFLGALFVTYNIWHTPKEMLTENGILEEGFYSFSEAIRYGFFQAITCMTTTGFATANYDAWPYFSHIMLLSMMFLGGMAGSTSGGLKSVRICILLETCRHQIRRFFAPSELDVMRVGKREIDLETSSGVLSYFFLVIVSGLFGLILLVLLQVDLETAFALMSSMLNNAGTSFRLAGPNESCAFLPAAGKVVCTIWMFLGRLEFYVWYSLLAPRFWKGD